MSQKTGSYPIYKKLGAAKLSLIPPTFNSNGWVEKEGALFVEASTGLGEDANGNLTYDWNNKIVFAIGLNDLALLFEDFSKKLVHVHQGKTKTLQFTAGSGKYEGTFMLTLSEKEEKGTPRSVSVPVSAGESQVIGVLLRSCPARFLGW